jgi:tetratricopeptide (TPR) repeat protein
MPGSSFREFQDRLARPVKDFSSRSFNLADDLARLAEVSRLPALEAAIIYGARILEVLAAEALAAVELGAPTSSFGCLELLQQFNLIPTGTRYWAHGLRRLGNDVRHVHRLMTLEDAHVALALTERVLDWFFCKFAPQTEKLASLTIDQKPLFLDDRTKLLSARLQTLEHTKPAEYADAMLADQAPDWLQTPLLPAVLAEALIEQKEYPRVRRVLDRALHSFETDLRLRQLMGLYLSRTSQLDAALEWLQPLYDNNPEDDETIGILAGTFKRCWDANTDEVESLRASHRLYRRGWELSRKRNTYLGINVATTALWLHRTDESRRLGADIRDLLLKRVGKVDRFRQQQDRALNYWDRATLAEAYLLAGQTDEARQEYAQAFAEFPEQSENIEISKKQARKILDVMKIAIPAGDAWFSMR